MLHRWFIVSSVRKNSYVDCWQDECVYKNGVTTVRVKGYPSFKKAGASVTSYATEQEAKAVISNYLRRENRMVRKYQLIIANIEATKPLYKKLSRKKKIRFLIKNNIVVEYTPRGSTYSRPLYLSYGYNYAYKREYDNDEKKAIDNNVKWDKSLKLAKQLLTLHQNRVIYITDKLFAEEQEIELKFNLNKRLRINWQERNFNDTDNGFCSCCGGAIPNIPQLAIGWDVKICVICMMKLAEEAKIYAGRVSDEILEHYAADKFLRDLD